jgi:cytosine/uracil/thiamine/allantoin permease
MGKPYGYYVVVLLGLVVCVGGGFVSASLFTGGWAALSALVSIAVGYTMIVYARRQHSTTVPTKKP